MMLVSLSSYCQYPVVKTIGKDTVVIMTVKQAEEINKKFLDLRDSINALDKTVNISKVEIDSLKTEKQKIDSSLVLTSEKLSTSDKRIESLDTLVKDEDKKHWREKRMWAGWMLLSIVTTVVVAALN
jgi:septal ring factor EnvC (AmiA/AmiB activator)